ncbi:MAG: leucyl aminopeptidase, partial [Pseudomonadota bacterium]
MKIQVQQNTLARVRDEILLTGLFEGNKVLQGSAADIDSSSQGIIKKVLSCGDFTGRLNQVLLLYPPQGLPAKRVLLVGLGKEKECTRDRLRGAAACAGRYVRDMGLKSFSIPLSFSHAERRGLSEKARDLAEGILLGLYQFKEFKTKNNGSGEKKITACTLLVQTAQELAAAQAGAHKAAVTAEAVYLARDLVTRPGNNATPAFLSDTAREIAKKFGLSCKVLNTQDAGRLGMGAFLSIARGSDEPARFIILEHKPKVKKQPPPIVLIGKAITFDSGGISLKPAKNMEEMKTDMAGGAAVMGALQACARLRLPVHVVGIIPATENLPSGHALKPGDIVTSLSGKTIEIISTDAEGRLILADALTYAQRFRPSAIIDLATLTGACVVALGNDVSG